MFVRGQSGLPTFSKRWLSFISASQLKKGARGLLAVHPTCFRLLSNIDLVSGPRSLTAIFGAFLLARSLGSFFFGLVKFFNFLRKGQSWKRVKVGAVLDALDKLEK